MARVLLADDGSVTTSLVTQAHCPLCVMGGAPPSFVSLVFEPVQALGRLLHSIAPARLAAATAAPPPARGPPFVL
jgi:hypothetical protein